MGRVLNPEKRVGTGNGFGNLLRLKLEIKTRRKSATSREGSDVRAATPKKGTIRGSPSCEKKPLGGR